MIREEDLLDAIAECQGERNPDAKTCIKLAAYYTILNNIKQDFKQDHKQDYKQEGYSFSSGQVSYDSGSEFSNAIKGLDMYDIMPVIDELMDTVQVLIPKLYNAVIQKLKDL